jgi:hypothetical protein
MNENSSGFRFWGPHFGAVQGGVRGRVLRPRDPKHLHRATYNHRFNNGLPRELRLLRKCEKCVFFASYAEESTVAIQFLFLFDVENLK